MFVSLILSTFPLAIQGTFVLNDNVAAHIFSSSARQMSQLASWTDLEHELRPPTTPPVSIDSVLNPANPTFSHQYFTLFRERHGWCPYSERVWLTAEIGNINYDTVRIDNTGHGPRPSFYSGQTPQIKWPDHDRPQGESMNLVYELNRRFSLDLVPEDQEEQISSIVSSFASIFPRARPSSRAAFLFNSYGDPLGRKTFENTLEKTDNLLSETEGPFLCGNDVTAADIAWAPFLERYRYQLPCLHRELHPDDPTIYPNLSAWYHAMDWQVPAYLCRVRGDASSWRKVLTMAGFGNAGLPPDIETTMKEREEAEEMEARTLLSTHNEKRFLWNEYARKRSYLASSPEAQAALVILENRQTIAKDLLKRADQVASWIPNLPANDIDAQHSLRVLVNLLSDRCSSNDIDEESITAAASAARYLDHRMCVPRDMGVLSAASVKTLAADLMMEQC